MTDRLSEIEQTFAIYGRYGIRTDQAEWLIAEVKRLREPCIKIVEAWNAGRDEFEIDDLITELREVIGD